jgi:hypothetical protein
MAAGWGSLRRWFSSLRRIRRRRGEYSGIGIWGELESVLAGLVEIGDNFAIYKWFFNCESCRKYCPFKGIEKKLSVLI